MGASYSDLPASTSEFSKSHLYMPNDIWTIENYEYYTLGGILSYADFLNPGKARHETWFISLKSSQGKFYVLEFSPDEVKFRRRTEFLANKNLRKPLEAKRVDRSLIGKKITTAGIRKMLKGHNSTYCWASNNCQHFVRYFIEKAPLHEFDQVTWNFEKYDREYEHWFVWLKSSEETYYVLGFLGVEFNSNSATTARVCALMHFHEPRTPRLIKLNSPIKKLTPYRKVTFSHSLGNRILVTTLFAGSKKNMFTAEHFRFPDLIGSSQLDFFLFVECTTWVRCAASKYMRIVKVRDPKYRDVQKFINKVPVAQSDSKRHHADVCIIITSVLICENMLVDFITTAGSLNSIVVESFNGRGQFVSCANFTSPQKTCDEQVFPVIADEE